MVDMNYVAEIYFVKFGAILDQWSPVLAQIKYQN